MLMQQAIISFFGCQSVTIVVIFLSITSLQRKAVRVVVPLIFPSVKILKWGALICRTEPFLGPRILNNTSGNKVVEKELESIISFAII